MLVLTSLEDYKSFFNTTEKITKVELYTDTFVEFSFTALKYELEEILGLSDIKSQTTSI